MRWPTAEIFIDCRDAVVSGCTILDGREQPLMRTAIEWRSSRGDDAPPDSTLVGCRLQNLSIPPSVRAADNVLGAPVP